MTAAALNALRKETRISDARPRRLAALILVEVLRSPHEPDESAAETEIIRPHEAAAVAEEIAQLSKLYDLASLEPR